MNLSVAIQTHPARAALAAALAAQTGAEVVTDPEPTNPARSPWRTYKACLEATPPTATHRLVLQDDVELCPHFLEAATAAVAAHPAAVMCFFVQGIYPYQDRVFWACNNDKPVANLRPDRWVPCVATCWPADVARAGLAYVAAQNWDSRIRADDEIAGRICRDLAVTVLATVPSLVEHPDELPSIGGKRRPMAGADPSRVAACFIAAGTDARSIDWRCEPSLRETYT